MRLPDRLHGAQRRVRPVVATGGGFSETDHITETDTLAAFGRSITGDPYHYTVQRTLDAAGNQLTAHDQGVFWSFVLPDGTRVHAAGWGNFNTRGPRSYRSTWPPSARTSRAERRS